MSRDKIKKNSLEAFQVCFSNFDLRHKARTFYVYVLNTDYLIVRVMPWCGWPLRLHVQDSDCP